MASYADAVVITGYDPERVVEHSGGVFNVPFELSHEPDEKWKSTFRESCKKHPMGGYDAKVEGATLQVRIPRKADPQAYQRVLAEMVEETNAQYHAKMVKEYKSNQEGDKRRQEFLEKLKQLKF